MTLKKTGRIVAVILAGGGGERMGQSQKQFCVINGKPILFYSIDVFLRCPFISGVIIVVPRGKISYVKLLVGRHYKEKIDIIVGGGTRRGSSYNALKFIRQKQRGCDYIIFHDGVRPLLSAEMIEAVVKAAKKYGAAVLASQALNVIAEVRRKYIRRAFNAKKVFNTQTPHCYRFDWIMQAHESGINSKQSRHAHENIELVCALGKKIKIVDRFYRNMKLTFPQDTVPIEALLKNITSEKFFRLN